MAYHISYRRVSTDEQGQSGLGLESQKQQIEKVFGKPLFDFVEIDHRDSENRPVLKEVVRLCIKFGCFISVSRQDRLIGDLTTTAYLIKNKVEFKAADNPSATDLIKGIYSVISADELAKIRMRTKESLDAKKRRGEPLGVHTWSEDSINRLDEILANARKNRTYTKPDPKKIETLKILKNAGVPFESVKDTAETLFGRSLSRATVYNYLSS